MREYYCLLKRIEPRFQCANNHVGTPIEIGKGRIIRRAGGIRALGEERPANGSSDSRLDSGISRGLVKENRVAILSLGTRLSEALIAADDAEAADKDLAITVADARFMKPLDGDLIRELVDENGIIITIEEGSIGGFGDHVLHFLANDGALDEGELIFRPMVLPDTYFEAATQYEQYEMAGLNSHHILDKILQLASKNKGEKASKNKGEKSANNEVKMTEKVAETVGVLE